MGREKMICSFLLLLSLTSCICESSAVTSYQATENHNVTLEWMFSTLIRRPTNQYIVYCEMFTDERLSVLFHLHDGVEVPQSQDKQFTGRVHYDKDVLTDGRLRLHLSRLRTEDSGVYVCQVIINLDITFSERRLNVSAAKNWHNHGEVPDATSWGWIGLYCGLALVAAAAAVLGVLFFYSAAIGID